MRRLIFAFGKRREVTFQQAMVLSAVSVHSIRGREGGLPCVYGHSYSHLGLSVGVVFLFEF